MKIKLFCFLFILFAHSTSLNAMSRKVNLEKAIDSAVSRYGLRTEPQLRQWFLQAHTQYPPKKIALLAFKKEQVLELWAEEDEKKAFWHHIHTYPLTANSGHLGPKLKERDRQIPEGIYKFIAYNPFSAMHLSLMINYPNRFDRIHAEQEGRKKLGGNIFLHGKSLSVGCLAVGDRAMDQLFLLTRRVGLQNVQVIIAPNDLRKGKPATFSFANPAWLPELYAQLTRTLHKFRA